MAVPTGGLAVLIRGLDDQNVADRLLRDVAGHGAEQLTVGGAKAAVADDDQVRRVGPRDFELGLRRLTLDDPPLDVPDALRREVIHRRAERRPGGLLAV